MSKQQNTVKEKPIFESESISCKNSIHKMVDKIQDEKLLKRIYNLVEYLYIYK